MAKAVRAQNIPEFVFTREVPREIAAVHPATARLNIEKARFTHWDGFFK
jgi:hypothetical protein